MLFKSVVTLSLAALALATPQGRGGGSNRGNNGDNGNNNNNNNNNGNAGNGNRQTTCTQRTVTQTQTAFNNPTCTNSVSTSTNIVYIAGFTSNDCQNDGIKRGPNDPYLIAITVPTKRNNGATGSCAAFPDQVSSLAANTYPSKLNLPSNCHLRVFTDQKCGSVGSQNWFLPVTSGALNTCQDNFVENAMSAQIVCE